MNKYLDNAVAIRIDLLCLEQWLWKATKVGKHLDWKLKRIFLELFLTTEGS
jgi:hypothetical protein